MINKDCFLNSFRIACFMLFSLLQAQTVLPDPQQRMIIQLDTPLSAEQRQTITQQMQSINQSGFTVLPHSTEQKWIIVINPPIDKETFENINSEIIRLEHVRYVETDQMMKALPRNE